MRARRALLAAFVFLSACPSVRLSAQEYWQQQVHYSIQASLDEPSGVLSGRARLVYRNNSPNTLFELFFHQYLNAFRPGSQWSADEKREGIDRFAALPDPYHAFERFGEVRIGGMIVAPEYINSPDSTVARFPLPRRLERGDSVIVELARTARPSVIPRRQGRQGRRFDFAPWYPKVAVYDSRGWQHHPLRLAGELYGEFGTYDVTLDLPDDQVVAATGLPVEGDPGWERANAGTTPPNLQRDWYTSVRRTSDVARRTVPGRKLVRFYAEDIHHFAFSLNPEYRYEEGRFGDVVLRTFYLPEDSASWGGGRVLERTHRAMAWLDTIFGAYPWPQAVVVHRIEDGGTEFPMMVMNGGPQESLIFHEIGHLYAYGILANNEWREAWLDEGLTTFQSAWNFQRRGMGTPSIQTQQLVLKLDLDGWSEPIAQPAENFSEYGIYQRMVYTKAQLVFEMLRYQVGEQAFRRGLRLYYDRWKLKHVDERAFRAAMEEASGQNLQGFFDQWLRETRLVDYAIGDVDNRELTNGSWQTRVTAERRGAGQMPVEAGVPAGDSVYTGRARMLDRRGTSVETAEVATPTKPGRSELDPERQTLDWNYLNNRQGSWLGPLLTLGSSRDAVHRIGWSSSAPARRDRLVSNWLPLVWWNDAGGVTVGFQQRTNYMGRYAQNALQLAYGTAQDWPDGFNGYLAIRNSSWAIAPRLRWSAEVFNLDGRLGVSLKFDRDISRHYSRGPRVSWSFSAAHLVVFDETYVDSRMWDAVYTVELTPAIRFQWNGERTTTELRGTANVGTSGLPAGFTYRDGRSWVRGILELRHRRDIGPFQAAGRLYADGISNFSGAAPPRQRLVYLAGADPYQTFMNPFLRSVGAPLAQPDVNYSAPGGGNLRGYQAGLQTSRALAGNVELVVPVLRQSMRRVFASLSLAGFADAAWLARYDSLGTQGFNPLIGDAGVGIRATHRIGPTTFTTRVDFPLFVSEPSAAAGATPGVADAPRKFRFVWSLEDAF